MAEGQPQTRTYRTCIQSRRHRERRL